MQEAVLAAAARSGAEIVRGASVTSVVPGFPAKVDYTNDGRAATSQARLRRNKSCFYGRPQADRRRQ